MAHLDRRQLLNRILIIGGMGAGGITLSGCVGSAGLGVGGIGVGASSKPNSKSKSQALDASKARIITNGHHVSQGAALTSAFRAGRGLGPVRPNSKLRRMAEGHALVMAKTGKVQHAIGFGDSFARRLHASGYDALVAGENIAGGFDTIEEAMQGWKDSPGHRKNMLKPTINEIGIGVARNPTARLKTYWAMVIAIEDRA
ncbi:MAG: CAP domain-containing protein [Hyphomicrobiales bacterium]